ncbi:PAN2-PAN3 deadenylation complex subunit Pan3p [[Candida] jaroonii]|uniref:PAN2-PAN3 deadenylation complex subunit Pan3p n=1 Tax=[Candida] jaroonii TaxID=467808 RepID=A0ACA9YAI7_9ASCO|nr:PAN2-PAN3 deadenylation complex subunit Pan3p [[Candida] jaroonii]
MNINVDSAKDTLCKNILIYGYCKYENKGCAFSHKGNKKEPIASPQPGNADLTGSTPTVSTPTTNKKKFNLNTPSFQPKSGKFSPKLDNVATFVPQDYDGGINSISISNGGKKFNTSANAFTPSSLDNPYTPPINPSMSTTSVNSPIQNHILPNSAGGQSINSNNGEMYYNQTNYPLNYHLYAPAPPPNLRIPLPPYETNANDMFIPNDLRESLTKKNAATLMTLNRSNLPENINVYHSLVPLDLESKSKVWKLNSAIFKVFSNIDGNAYTLRKIEFDSTIDSENFKTIKRWKSIKNSNIVKLQDCFTSIAFDGLNSKLVMIYDYYPESMTLLEQHFNRKLGYKLEPITEDLLWIYIIQITNALMTIHENGLAARSSLSLSKIIVTNKNRIRLSSVGIDDILNYENDKGYNIKTIMSNEQKLDLKRFGDILIELCNLLLPLTQRNDLNSLKSVISNDLFEVISKLVNDYELINLEKFNQFYLSSKTIRLVNNLQDSNDYVESQLTRELENARLFRLITKINFIIDSPVLNWEENDRVYLIKLFHDYIFHKMSDGKPVVDLSRVLVKLNKLDVGIEERFLLISKDEKSSILVSYKEIRDLIDSVFRELTK